MSPKAVRLPPVTRRRGFRASAPVLVLWLLSAGPIAATGAADPEAACRFLTPELIAGVVPLEGAEVATRPSKHSYHPLCTATWPKPNQEALKEKQQQLMQDYISAKAQGRTDVKFPIVNTDNEITLTLNEPPSESEVAARTNFEGMIDMVEEGITTEAEVGGTKRTARFQANYDRRVEGVGDAAAWSTKLSQLSVVSGRRIFHVTARVADDSDGNLDVAKAVATQVITHLD